MIKFEVIQGDILEQEVNVIVNAANQSLRGGGGVDGAIHDASGKELNDECKELGGCSTGKVKLTKSYDLEDRGIGWIIHAVGPRYAGGMYFEADLLKEAYEAALDVTINPEEFYKEQCLYVLDKYIGHLEDIAKYAYVKETKEEVKAYCQEYPIKSIAFPSISTGIYGYPLEEAAKIAVRAIKNFCRRNDHLDRIVMVCYDTETYNVYKKLVEY